MYDDKPSMKLPRTIYWLSLLLLIVGGRTLIDPSNRSPGETIQIYITLVAFEAYMWLLLVLARWQCGKALGADVARSGLFAIGLQGLTFLAINELHMASTSAGIVIAVAATVLAGLKLLIAWRWLKFELPIPLAVLSGCWMVLMVASGLIFRHLPQGEPIQQTAAYVLCWIAAALAGAHGILAAWRCERIRASEEAGERWWVAWLMSGALGLMTVIQFYGNRRGFFLDFPLSFFTPMLAVGAMSGVVLSMACGKGAKPAWAALGNVIVIMLVINQLPVHTHTEAAWMDVADGFFVHALYPAGVAASLLAIVAGARLRSKLLLFIGIGVFVLAGVVRLLILLAPMLWRTVDSGIQKLDALISRILAWRYAQGVFLLGGAFITLGIGAWLQRRSAALHEASMAGPAEPQGDGDGEWQELEGQELIERLEEGEASPAESDDEPKPPPADRD